MDSAAAAAAAKRVQIEKAHNFMRQYRDPESRELKKLSANQFMDVWAHYDKDGMYSLWVSDLSNCHAALSLSLSSLRQWLHRGHGAGWFSARVCVQRQCHGH